MRTLVYTSTQTRPISDSELAQILAVGREKNTRLGITGMLAHRDANCIGIIEGEDDVVHERLEQIRLDPRHTNVRVLCDDPVQQRSFPDWSMAFQPLDPLMREVPGFSDLFDTQRPTDAEFGASRARALLEWFRKHPLAPLTSQDSADAEAPRTRVLNGAIAVLHDAGTVAFSTEAVAERCGMRVAEIEGLFPNRHALLAATVERWSLAVSAPAPADDHRARHGRVHARAARRARRGAGPDASARLDPRRCHGPDRRRCRLLPVGVPAVPADDPDGARRGRPRRPRARHDGPGAGCAAAPGALRRAPAAGTADAGHGPGRRVRPCGRPDAPRMVRAVRAADVLGHPGRPPPAERRPAGRRNGLAVEWGRWSAPGSAMMAPGRGPGICALLSHPGW
ncbi:BLUF domain-containing protein [Curtobacterium sp. MCPF17_052]|nr:BLUF domain-containing protein [Curtobacterium sp. MCPF17_052]WIB11300.1 BLUF domain-containing protein [Curtobacterium sp. MCPF17_052]